MKKLLKINPKSRLIIFLGVFVLTMLTIGISYSAFLSVKSNTNNQTVKTGTLNVTYTNSSTSLTNPKMERMSDADGLAQTDASYIYLSNTGTLPANYALTIGYDTTEFNKVLATNPKAILTPLEYIKIAVYDYASPNNEKLILGPVTLADLVVYKGDLNSPNNNRYFILFDKLEAVNNATKTYKVKTWLSSDATPFASNSYFYVNSQVIAEVDETRLAYNFKGILKNSAGSGIANAEINIQNNSQIAQTDAQGNFTLNNLLPGTYNVDIKVSDKIYNSIIIIKKSDVTSVTKSDSSFVAKLGDKLPTMAYTYATTINQLKKANNITDISSTFAFASKSYNLPVSYIIFGANQSNIENLTITLGDTDIKEIALT